MAAKINSDFSTAQSSLLLIFMEVPDTTLSQPRMNSGSFSSWMLCYLIFSTYCNILVCVFPSSTPTPAH